MTRHAVLDDGACGAFIKNEGAPAHHLSTRGCGGVDAPHPPSTSSIFSASENFAEETEREMGGFGSGRWPSVPPTFVEDARRIKSAEIPSVGAARVCRWADGGAVLVRRVDDQVASVHFRLAARTVDVTIPLNATAMTFGVRVDWRCPLCSRTARSLCVITTGVCCRQCAGLRYQTQYMSPLDRASARVDRAARCLGGMDDDQVVRRPYRMRRSTFGDRLDDLRAAQAALRQTLTAEVKRLQMAKAQLDARSTAKDDVVDRHNKDER